MNPSRTFNFSPTLTSLNNPDSDSSVTLGSSPPPGFSLSSALGGSAFNIPSSAVDGGSAFSNNNGSISSGGRPSRGSSFNSFDSRSGPEPSSAQVNSNGGVLHHPQQHQSMVQPTAVPYAPQSLPLYPPMTLGNGVGGVGGVGGMGNGVGVGTNNVQQQQSQQHIIAQQQQIQMEIRMQQEQIQHLQARLQTQMAQMQWHNPQGNPNQVMQLQPQMMSGPNYGGPQNKNNGATNQNGMQQSLTPSSYGGAGSAGSAGSGGGNVALPNYGQAIRRGSHQQQQQPASVPSALSALSAPNASTKAAAASTVSSSNKPANSSTGRPPIVPTNIKSNKPTSGGWASIVASNRPSKPPSTTKVHRGKTQSLQKKQQQQQQQQTSKQQSNNNNNNNNNQVNQTKQRTKHTTQKNQRHTNQRGGASNNNHHSHHQQQQQQRRQQADTSSSSSSNNTTKQQNKIKFSIDIETLKKGEEKRTTLMIQNIPNKYTRQMLVDELNDLHYKQYDFIYLPIDFRNKCNLGYAFINMITPMNVINLHTNFCGASWKRSRSEKKADVKWGRLQGKQALIDHFRASSFLKRIPHDCRPISFYSSGANIGEVEYYIGGDET